MRPPSLFSVFALLALLFLMTAGSAMARIAEPEPTARPADRARLEELAAEQRVATQMPEPGIAHFVQDTSLRLVVRLMDWASSWIGNLVGFAGSGVWFLLILFVALGGLISLLLLRAVTGRRVRRNAAAPVVVSAEPEAGTGGCDCRWEAELRRRIEEGKGAEAATALWWWLADRLIPSGVDAAWTSRELLETADRRELRPGLRSLDRLLYGASEPVVEEVAELWDELRVSLG